MVLRRPKNRKLVAADREDCLPARDSATHKVDDLRLFQVLSAWAGVRPHKLSEAVAGFRGRQLIRLAVGVLGVALLAARAVEAAEPPSTAANTKREVLTRFTASGSLRATVAASLAADEKPDEPAAGTIDVVEHAVAADATLRYTEQPVAAGPIKEAGQTALRHYSEAEASLRIDGSAVRSVLPPEARTLFAATTAEGLCFWLAEGFVTQEERDLLTLPFDTAWHSILEPPPAAAEGTTWTLKSADLAKLLCIDTITAGTATAAVEQVSGDHFTISLSGSLRGGVDGVPTEIELTATYGWNTATTLPPGLVSLRAQIHERRQAGYVTPGLDIEAVLEQTCRRLDAEQSSHQAPPAVEAAPGISRRGPGGPGSLWLTDPHGRFNLVHDDGWRIIEQQSDQTVLRLLDHGRLLGQVSIIPLPPTAEAPSLAAFQDDIERSLGGQFNHLVEATESRRSNGTRILRVASDGEADGLPFRWIHYHLAAENGTQATLSFMVESGQQERFGEADRLFIDGFVITRPSD